MALHLEFFAMCSHRGKVKKKCTWSWKCLLSEAGQCPLNLCFAHSVLFKAYLLKVFNKCPRGLDDARGNSMWFGFTAERSFSFWFLFSISVSGDLLGRGAWHLMSLSQTLANTSYEVGFFVCSFVSFYCFVLFLWWLLLFLVCHVWAFHRCSHAVEPS